MHYNKKISDKAKKQYLVPDSPLGMERPKIKHAAENPYYDFKYTAKPFGFKVIRKSDRATIFDTTNLPLVFEDQYLEISTAIPKDANIYGLGEVTAPFRRTTVSIIYFFLEICIMSYSYIIV
jgi:alpha-glucosidase